MMMTGKHSEDSAKSYIPGNYWAGVAENYRFADEAGLAPVLYPDAPPWFNHLMDGLQWRAMRRALALAKLPPGAQILDVGCGTGRWIRRYRDWGFRATGIDAQYGMLQTARTLLTQANLIAGNACRLPLADNSFDGVSDVTVVQHIPAPLQQQAVGELLRVLRPGGHLLLMELIRGEDRHIFPRSPEGWIRLASSCGAKLIDWFGGEFFLLDRAFVRMAQSLPRSRRGSSWEAGPKSTSGTRRIYWSLRHITAQLSAWSDPVVEKVCPDNLATHGIFVLRK